LFVGLFFVGAGSGVRAQDAKKEVRDPAAPPPKTEPEEKKSAAKAAPAPKAEFPKDADKAEAKPAEKPAAKADEKTEVKTSDKAAEKAEMKADGKTEAEPKPEEKDDEPARGPRSKVAVKKRESAPRQAQIDRPGAPREPIAQFREGEQLAGPKLSNAEIAKFDEMRKGGVGFEANLVDKFSKARVYELTNPAEANDLPRKIDAIIQDIRSATRPGAQQANIQFVQAYKRALAKYAKDIMAKGSLVAKVNAILLLTRMMEEEDNRREGNVPDPIDTMIEVVRTPGHEDAIYYLALQGLTRAKEVGLISVKQEDQLAQELLVFATKPNVQDLLFEMLVSTLSKMKIAYSGTQVPEVADVATFLGNVALNSKFPIRTRFEAAMGLAGVNVSRVNGWNYQLQGWIIANTFIDMVRAYQNGEVKEDFVRWWAVQMGEALSALRDKAKDDESFRAMLSAIGAPIQTVIDRGSPDLAPIETWLRDSRPQAGAKLAPKAAPIVMPAADAAVGN
jgi:hypothetical protein